MGVMGFVAGEFGYLRSGISVQFAVYGIVLASTFHMCAAQRSCRTTCGDKLIKYPYGIDPGCGNLEFNSLFRCTSANVLNFVALSGLYPVNSIDYATRSLSLLDNSMTSCNGGIVQGKNFSLGSTSKVSLSDNTNLLLLNCKKNATLTKSPQFSCNETAEVCSAFKACADFGISDPEKLVLECCSLKQNTNTSIDVSLLNCTGYSSVHNYNSSAVNLSKLSFYLQLAWIELPRLVTSQCALCTNSSGDCGYNSTGGFSCLCGDRNTTSVCPLVSSDSKTSLRVIVGAAVGGGVAIVLAIILALVCYRRSKVPFETFEFEVDGMSEAPTRFKYKELALATENFNNELGKGGFGAVYKGVLANGQAIAVKRLEKSGQGEKQFRAEVATIGNVHHFNLVRFFGYCFERWERLLVYEFMSNGSLEKYLFTKPNREAKSLTWDQRFSIASDIARGLAYLHEGCRKRILHCDVKPENILLDDSFSAKLSDFGLAKLMDRQDVDAFTVVRGTRGYLAPEWFVSNSPITEKCDVYSFGMVVLELIGGRKNVDFKVSSAKFFFHTWVYEQLTANDLSEIVDKHLEGKVDEQQVVKLARVALACVQEEPAQRPAMSKVVQVLEGASDIQMPTSPFRRFDFETSESSTPGTISSFAAWSYSYPEPGR